jgi:hypothetical protein
MLRRNRASRSGHSAVQAAAAGHDDRIIFVIDEDNQCNRLDGYMAAH